MNLIISNLEINKIKEYVQKQIKGFWFVLKIKGVTVIRFFITPDHLYYNPNNKTFSFSQINNTNLSDPLIITISENQFINSKLTWEEYFYKDTPALLFSKNL